MEFASGSGRNASSSTLNPSTARVSTPSTRPNDSISSPATSMQHHPLSETIDATSASAGARDGDREDRWATRWWSTGAAGRIGTYLRHVDGGLPARGWELVLVDTVDPGEPHTAIDIGDDGALDALTDAMTGAAAVVHLAGIPHEDTWDALRRTNIDGTYRVLEAARRAGVRRVVLASSCHAVGFYPTGTVAPTDRPVRPDTLYGVSKAGARGARQPLRGPARAGGGVVAHRQLRRPAAVRVRPRHLAEPRRRRPAGRRRAARTGRRPDRRRTASRPTPAAGGT